MAKKKAGRKRSHETRGNETEQAADLPVAGAGSATTASSDDGPEADGAAADDETDGESERASSAEEADAEAKAEASAAPDASAADAVLIAAPIAHPTGAAWGRPFVRISRGFDWLETRLLAVVLGTLTFLLVGWVSLAGMASPLEASSPSGTVFRGILGAIVLGGASRFAGAKLGWSNSRKALLTVAAVILAIVVAPMWRGVGVAYFGGIQNWLQEGSSLAMLGGLRGVGTRFTILLALVGASLAAAGGKHISIDVMLRFLPGRLKIPVFALSTISTAVVLFASSWGFVDYIAIESFNYRPADMQQEGAAPRDNSASAEVAYVAAHVGDDLFLFRKQVGLDLSALPHVMGGGKWDDPSRMNGRQWNELVDGFKGHFPPEEVEALRAPPEQLDESRVPMVVVPGGGGARGLLVHSMNLMFPIGFIFIGLRFLLRLALVASGHTPLEDGSAHGPAAPPAPASSGEVV